MLNPDCANHTEDFPECEDCAPSYERASGQLTNEHPAADLSEADALRGMLKYASAVQRLSMAAWLR
jgi:hypothetical protein